VALYYYENVSTAILIIIVGQFQAVQRFSSSKLVLKTVGYRFVALYYYENGSTANCKTNELLSTVFNQMLKAYTQLITQKKTIFRYFAGCFKPDTQRVCQQSDAQDAFTAGNTHGYHQENRSRVAT
jgi:hypothetical protein